LGIQKKSDDFGDILSVHIPNGPRYTAIVYLSRGGESIDRESASVFFENLFRELQASYKQAANHYHSLRTYLL
jgi:hypothetical protein